MIVHRMPNSMKFLMPSLKESTLVLFTVLLIIIDIKCTVDGFSTANERGMYTNFTIRHLKIYRSRSAKRNLFKCVIVINSM